MNRYLGAAVGAVVLGGGLCLMGGTAQAAVGQFNCVTVIETNISLGLVNGFNCTGTLGNATAGTITENASHRSYSCLQLQTMKLGNLLNVAGGHCTRR